MSINVACLRVDADLLEAFATSRHAPWIAGGLPGLPVQQALGRGQTVVHIPWAERHRHSGARREAMDEIMRYQMTTGAFRTFEREWRQARKQVSPATTEREDGEEEEEGEELTQQLYAEAETATQPDDDDDDDDVVVVIYYNQDEDQWFWQTKAMEAGRDDIFTQVDESKLCDVLMPDGWGTGPHQDATKEAKEHPGRCVRIAQELEDEQPRLNDAELDNVQGIKWYGPPPGQFYVQCDEGEPYVPIAADFMDELYADPKYRAWLQEAISRRGATTAQRPLDFGRRRSARQARTLVPYDPSDQDAKHKAAKKAADEKKLAGYRAELAHVQGKRMKTVTDRRKLRSLPSRIQAMERLLGLGGGRTDETDDEEGSEGEDDEQDEDDDETDEDDEDGPVYGIRCGRHAGGTAMEAVPWAWQKGDRSGAYKRVEYQQIRELLLPDYAAQVREAYERAGRTTGDWGRSVRFPSGDRRKQKQQHATGADVPVSARTTTGVRFQFAQGFCVPDSIANVLPEEIARAHVVVDGTPYQSTSQYLRSICNHRGDIGIPAISAAVTLTLHEIQVATDWFQLRKWNKPLVGLRYADRIAAIVGHAGKLVVSCGEKERHTVGISHGQLYDNDIDFPTAINLRAVGPIRLVWLWRVVLQLGYPHHVREVVVIKTKSKKRKHGSAFTAGGLPPPPSSVPLANPTTAALAFTRRLQCL